MKHRRRGLVWRLAAVVFAVVVVLFVFSFVVHPQIRAEYYPYGEARGDAYSTLRLNHGRLTGGRVAYGGPPAPVSEIATVLDRMGRGWVVEMYTVRAPFSYDRPWWALPGQEGGTTSRGAYSAYSIPLVYVIALLGVGLLVPMVGGRASKRQGGCQSCGYPLEGIASGVCPECGVECA